MSFTIGVLLQVGQPPAVAVPPVYPAQPVIDAQVVSSSLQATPTVGSVKQDTLKFYNPKTNAQPSYAPTYNSFGEKGLDQAQTGAFLDIFA